MTNLQSQIREVLETWGYGTITEGVAKYSFDDLSLDQATEQIMKLIESKIDQLTETPTKSEDWRVGYNQAIADMRKGIE